MAKNSGVRDIARVLSEKHGISLKKAEEFLNAFFEVVNEGLKESNLVKIKSLGTFKVIEVKDRESVNVSTGERFVIEGRNKITFTPDAVMKELVNRPFSQFETVVLNDGVDFGALDETEIPENDDIEPETVAPELDVSNLVEPQERPTESISTNEPDEIEEPLDEVEETIATDENQDNTVEPLDVVAESVDAKVPIVEAEEPIDEVEEHAEIKEPAIEVDDSVSEIGEPAVFDEMKSDEEGQEPTSVDGLTNTDAQYAIEEPESDESVRFGLVNTERERVEPESDELYEETDMDNKKTNWWGRILSFLVVAILAFGGGYYLGNKLAPTRYVPVVESEMIEEGHDSIMRDSTQINDSILKSQDARIKQRVDSVTRINEARNDSLKGLKNDKRSVDVSNKTKKTETNHVSEQSAAANSQKPEVSVNQSQVINNARKMMTHGAYNIVGTEQTITVRAGQSLKSIARSYLGPGMECYIQVHNGVAEVKEGDKLKIPKLQLKKR